MKRLRATVVLLVACGGGDAGSPRLQSGGIAVGVDGVTIGAPAGALAGTIDLVMTKESTPPVALPAGVAAAGGFYRIAATPGVVSARADAPLVVGLPLPTGITSENAGVAVLVPGASVHDGGVSAWWSIVPAAVQADRKLVVIPLGALPAEGLSLAVVARPDQPVAVRTSAAAVARAARRADEAPSFQAICDVTFALPGVPETCTHDDLEFAAMALEGHHDNFVNDFGFEPPWLYRPLRGSGPLAEPLGPLDLGPYTVTLVPHSLHPDWVGLYDDITRTLYVALGAPGGDDELLKTVRHEYFHATQWAYPSVRDSATDAWVIEGTATAVENSATSFDRYLGRLFRSPDAGFNDDSDDLEYQAQDFWVYVGRRAGRGVDMFRLLFGQGPAAEDVDRFLHDDLALPGLPDLPGAYWAWAKNQAYEKSLNLGTQLFPNPCEPHEGVVAPGLLEFDPDGGGASVEADLVPLSSKLYEVRLAAPRSYTARIDVEAALPDGRVKLYRQGDTACEVAADGEGLTVAIAEGEPRVFYVLFANAGFTGGTAPAGSVRVTVVDDEPASGDCEFNYWEYRWEGAVSFEWNDSASAGSTSASFQHGGTGEFLLLGQGSGGSSMSGIATVDERYTHTGNPNIVSSVVSDGQPSAHVDLYLFTNRCTYSFAASWFVPVKVTYMTDQGTTISMRDNYLVGAFDSGTLPMEKGATTLAGSAQSTFQTDASTALNFILQTKGTIQPGTISWSFQRVAAPPQ